MGDVFRQRYTRNGVTKTLRKWYGEYRDEKGELKRVALSSDKQAARSMLHDLEKDVERRRAGFVDTFTESGKTPIDELVGQYLMHLRLVGRGDRHIADTTRLLNIVIKACGFNTLAKLKALKLNTYLGGLTTSARTKKTHRQAIMGFGNWCVKLELLEFNPLAKSTMPNGDTVLKRRALSVDQLKKLLDVARERPLREKMIVRSGPNKGKPVANISPATRGKMERQGRLRVLLYRTAFYTGLRRNELRGLRVCHLHLEGAEPKATLPGTLTKNGKPATLPLRPELANELHAWIRSEGLAGKDNVFPVGRDVAKHLRRDMEAANIPRFDDNGRVFDFHAFRKCTATHMNKSGVPITTAKEMMRHSTVELTAGIYNDGECHDLRAAIGMLPSL